MKTHMFHFLAGVMAVVGPGVSYGAGGQIAPKNTDPDGTVTQAAIELLVYTDTPRTTDEMADVEEQLKRTNTNICDYTDGRFYISKVTFSANPADKKDADVWWLRMRGRSYSDCCGSFGLDKVTKDCNGNTRTPGTGHGRVSIFSNFSQSQGLVYLNGEVLSHEFGHLIFGLADEYGDSRATEHAIVQGDSVNGYTGVADAYTGNRFFRTISPLGTGDSGDDLTYMPAAMLGDVSPKRLDGTSMYVNSFDGSAWWATNNSVMQQSGMAFCRRADGRRPWDIDPILASWGAGCRNDKDCEGMKNKYVRPGDAPSDFTSCIISPTSSELTVYDNTGLSRYNLTLGRTTHIDRTASRIREAKELVLQGLLGSSYFLEYPLPPAGTAPATKVADVHAPPSGWPVSDGAVNDEFLCSPNEPALVACPLSQATGSPNPTSSQVSSCFGHIPIDTSACKPAMGASLCGNNTIDHNGGDIGEQCDTGGNTGIAVKIPLGQTDAGQDLTCDKVFSLWRVLNGSNRADTEPVLKFNNNAKVYCRSNCTLDLSRCSLPLGEVKTGTTLADLRDASDRTLRAEVFDKLGQISLPKDPDGDLKYPFGDLGPSNHIVFVFLKRTGRARINGVPAGGPDPGAYDIWQATFAMDKFESGGTWGEANILKSMEIVFATDKNANRGPVSTADGNVYSPFNPLTWPVLNITGLTRGDPAFDLKVNLDNLETVRTLDENDKVFQDPTGRLGFYARHGTTPPINGVVFEMPQYGSAQYLVPYLTGKPCDDDCKTRARFYELVAYNAETGRIDTPRSFMDQLTSNPTIYDKRKGDEAVLVADLEANLRSYVYSAWEQMRDKMCTRWKMKIAIPPTPDRIRGLPETSCAAGGACSCPDPTFDTTNAAAVDFDENTQIVLVLDRSGSMGTVQDKNKPASRLDYVKTAGLDLMRDIGWNEIYRRDPNNDGTPENPTVKGPKVGLVWFSDNSEAQFPIPFSDARSCSKDSDCNNPTLLEAGVCTGGKCKPTMPRLECNKHPSDTKDCDDVGPLLTKTQVTEEIMEAAYMRPTPAAGSNGAAGPLPEASGWTATGAAIQAAGRLFDPNDSGAKRVVVLLTDGFSNRPSGGKCWDGKAYQDAESCWPGSNAAAAVNDAITKLPANTSVYAVPLGVSGDRELTALNVANGTVNGQVFQARRNYGEDTIPAFFEVYAAMRGQQLARAADSLPIMRDDKYTTPVEYEIPVEVGASILHVSVSNYDAAADSFLDIIDHVALVSPSGKVYERHPTDPSQKDYISDFSAGFHIPVPESGTWVVKDGSWAATSTHKEDRHGRLYVAAFAENPVPSCDVNTNASVSDGTLPVTIRAQAWNERPVANGDSYNVLLQRPDMTVVEFALAKSDQGQPAIGEVGPSQFTGDGLYVATVTCKVTEGAPLVKGEWPQSLNSAPPEPDRTSHAFTREVHAYFQVKGTGIIPLPGVYGDNQDPTVLSAHGLPAGYSPVVPFLIDSDGDGIVNPLEPPPTVDSNHDGRPDVFDPDSNDNGIVDGEDPAIPYSPVADGTGAKCSVINAATCCASIDRCVGGLSGVTIFAEGSLSVRDRAKVITNANGVATLINAGTTGSSIGVDAKAGNIRSAGSIDLRDRAAVSGYAISAGSITMGNGATIGESYPKAGISFPHVLGFSVAIPVGTTGVTIQPGKTGTVAPGKYSNLTVNSRATAYLSSGTYNLQSLDVEPQGVLALDMSHGPIYLYVAKGVIYRGSIILRSGVSSDLFIGYMGTQSVALEAPFTGTFVAPKASLAIGPPSGCGLFAGGFYAKDIEVRPDVEVRGAAFGHIWRH